MVSNTHILNIARGDYEAFELLHKELYKRMFYFVYKLIQDKEQSEDIVQDAFLKYWDNREDFTDFLSVKVYLYTVSKNSVLHHIRDEKRHKRIMASLEFEETFSENQLLIATEIIAEIQQAINALPAQTQRVITLSMNEKKVEEIARELNISPNTVKTLKKNGYLFLRNRLAHLKVLLPFLFLS